MVENCCMEFIEPRLDDICTKVDEIDGEYAKSKQLILEVGREMRELIIECVHSCLRC